MRVLPRRGRSEMCVPPTVAGSTHGPVDTNLPLTGTAGTRFYSQAFPTAQHQTVGGEPRLNLPWLVPNGQETHARNV